MGVGRFWHPSWAGGSVVVAALTALAGLAAAARPCTAQTTGLIPLTDLGPGHYLGFQGGLYPGGANAPPASHEAAAMQMAAQIVPRNAAGAPDPQGFIVMIAVGMSNTTHEFGAFERNEDANPRRNARLVLVDTALGGQTAAIISDPTAPYWTTMNQRLTAMGVTPAQVQVAWLKEADAVPPNDFPGHAQVLRNELETVVNNLHDKFPNLKLCYLSSRIYGGYAPPGSLNPDPQAYETGFSAKWLIEDQIGGDPGLNYGQITGPVRAPLLLWGPYLWADGTNPRSDGLTWLVSDLESDFTHPSPSGEQKVAGLLSNFFAHEATAVPWWPATASTGLIALDVLKDAHVSAAAPASNFGSATTLLEQGGASPMNLYLGFNASGVPRPVSLAKLSLRVLNGGGGRVSGVSSTSWSEGTINFSNAPAIGSPILQMPGSSRDGTIGANLTSGVNADADGVLSLALTTTGGQLDYHSKEDGQPPRLVVAVSCAAAADADGDGRGDPCDCAPADPGVFAPPTEVAHLRWSDASHLAWDSDAANSGAATRYDLMSGNLSAVSSMGSGPGDVCRGSALGGTQTADASPVPSAGAGFFFLVRATNTCGKSRYETASDGRDRLATACP